MNVTILKLRKTQRTRSNSYLEESSSKEMVVTGPSLPLLNFFCSFLKPESRPACCFTTVRAAVLGLNHSLMICTT